MLDWIQLIAVVGTGAAVLATWLWRSAAVQSKARQAQNDELVASLAGLEADLDKERKARARQADELGEFRKRADKAKRRGGKNAPQPMGTASRIQDLEDASEKATLERDRLRRERDGLAEEIAQLRARMDAQALAAAAAAKESATQRAPAADDSTATLEASLAEAHERIAKFESEEQIARQTHARMRKRIDTQEQLYASLRSELEVKKDRLRTQEEQLQRLQALKVAVLD